MPSRIAPIRSGQAIKATRLNKYGENINRINDFAVDPPKGVDDAGEAQAEGDTVPTTAFVEVSRTTSEVQVFDDVGENYALIDRIDKVILANADGDTLEFHFTN